MSGFWTADDTTSQTASSTTWQTIVGKVAKGKDPMIAAAIGPAYSIPRLKRPCQIFYGPRLPAAGVRVITQPISRTIHTQLLVNFGQLAQAQFRSPSASAMVFQPCNAGEKLDRF